MNQEILEMIRKYQNAIHTQQAEDFLPLWDESIPCTLISPSGFYQGVDSIYQNFLLDGIRKAYSRIDLISDEINIRLLDERNAVVLFSYHTDCNRRETGEPFGIAGLETQVYHKGNAGWKLVHVHYSVNKV